MIQAQVNKMVETLAKDMGCDDFLTAWNSQEMQDKLYEAIREGRLEEYYADLRDQESDDDLEDDLEGDEDEDLVDEDDEDDETDRMPDDIDEVLKKTAQTTETAEKETTQATAEESKCPPKPLRYYREEEDAAIRHLIEEPYNFHLSDLQNAMWAGDQKQFRYLLNKMPYGAVQRIDLGWTDAHVACAAARKWNDMGMLIEVLERTPELVNIQNDLGLTPLHVAAYYGMYDVVSMLRTKAASRSIVSKSERTARGILKDRQSRLPHGQYERTNRALIIPLGL